VQLFCQKSCEDYSLAGLGFAFTQNKSLQILRKVLVTQLSTRVLLDVLKRGLVVCSLVSIAVILNEYLRDEDSSYLLFAGLNFQAQSNQFYAFCAKELMLAVSAQVLLMLTFEGYQRLRQGKVIEGLKEEFFFIPMFALTLSKFAAPEGTNSNLMKVAPFIFLLSFRWKGSNSESRMSSTFSGSNSKETSVTRSFCSSRPQR